MRMPTFRNFFKTITTGTYADEFAENHFSTMVSRYMAGAFVPSAGTGFVLSRETLQSFGDEDVLPRTSLTEDYRLSLTLFERGIRMYYVLERAPRINNKGKLVWDYIATRSIFPNTFKTATKQKTRWIYGITMQSFRLSDIFQNRSIPLAGRYSLYKDIKAKVGNLLVMVGYPILIYYFASLFVALPAIFPKGTLSWYFSLIVTAMMLERQLFRSVAIYNVYGMRSVFFACLLPPVLPLRLVWGNIINMVSTVRAYKQKWFGISDQKKKTVKKKGDGVKEPRQKQISWAKTDHAFLEKSVLQQYRRKLGDILIERGYVTPEVLQRALKNAAAAGEPIGAYLRKQGVITEEQLLDALSNVKHIQYVHPTLIEAYGLSQFAPDFDQSLLEQLLALPLIQIAGGYVFAFCDDSPNDAQTTLRNTYGICIRAEFLTRSAIEHGLRVMYDPNSPDYEANTLITQLFAEGRMNYEQVILAQNYCFLLNKPEEEILSCMGLLTSQQVFLEEAIC